METLLKIISFLMIIYTLDKCIIFAEEVKQSDLDVQNKIIVTGEGYIIKMPLNKILLIRSNSVYCAVKFTEFYRNENGKAWRVSYESHYQEDKSGDFSNKNIRITQNTIYFSEPPRIGKYQDLSSDEKKVCCGPFRIYWFDWKWYIHNEKAPASKFEIAPTEWTDITQVNVLDSSLKWHTDITPPGPDDIFISGRAVSIPIEKILLLRKGLNYGAIKFINTWEDNTSETGTLFTFKGSDKYALYESYYQNDQSVNFSNKNVKKKKNKLSFPKPRGIGRFAFSLGNNNIQCGSIKLFWFGNCTVGFFSQGQKEGDYGIELAPTKWTDISQINVFDSRLKWHKYEKDRINMKIPIDLLWEETEY